MQCQLTLLAFSLFYPFYQKSFFSPFFPFLLPPALLPVTFVWNCRVLLEPSLPLFPAPAAVLHRLGSAGSRVRNRREAWTYHSWRACLAKAHLMSDAFPTTAPFSPQRLGGLNCEMHPLCSVDVRRPSSWPAAMASGWVVCGQVTLLLAQVGQREVVC